MAEGEYLEVYLLTELNFFIVDNEKNKKFRSKFILCLKREKMLRYQLALLFIALNLNAV